MNTVSTRQAGTLLTEVLAWCAKHPWNGGDVTLAEVRRATAALSLDTGPRYHFGTIITVQDSLEDAAMRRLLRMREGDPYTLDALLRAFDQSQHFIGVVE